MSKVSILIVTWNSTRYISDCLDSIMEQTFKDFSVLVVDNGSSDKTVEIIRSNYPTVSVLENFKNLGFAKGSNQGVLLAKSEYLLTLNSDAIIEPDFLENILTFADQHPKSGSFNPKLYRLTSQAIDYDDQAGFREMVKTDILDSAGLMIYKSRKVENRGEGQQDEGQFDRAEEIFGVSGACALYRMAALKDVMIKNETYDSDFFSYKEDIDLAWRLRLYGWESWYDPDSIGYHHRGLSSQGKEMKKIIRHRKSVSKFLRILSFKNHHLMLVKNDLLINIFAALPWFIFWEIKIILYALILEPWQFKTLFKFFKLLPNALLKRGVIMAHRKVSPQEIRKWFN